MGELTDLSSVYRDDIACLNNQDWQHLWQHSEIQEGLAMGKDRAGVPRAGPQGWLRVGQKRLQRDTRSSTTCPIRD
jgi:hypothetical protein